MKAPDKVYYTQTEHVANYFTTGKPFERDCVEYIRKDALLEWAKKLKERWEEPPMSKHSPGCVYMLEQLIEKLNSM